MNSYPLGHCCLFSVMAETMLSFRSLLLLSLLICLCPNCGIRSPSFHMLSMPDHREKLVFSSYNPSHGTENKSSCLFHRWEKKSLTNCISKLTTDSGLRKSRSFLLSYFLCFPPTPSLLPSSKQIFIGLNSERGTGDKMASKIDMVPALI